MCEQELRIVDYAHGKPVKWVAHSFQEAKIVGLDGATVWEGHADDLAAMPAELATLRAAAKGVLESAIGCYDCDCDCTNCVFDALRIAAGLPKVSREEKPDA